MLISLILAWVAVLFAVLAALKFVTRKLHIRALDRFFHNCHIPFGVLALVTGLIHGLLAGNPSFATLSDCTFGSVLFTLNWGTGCFVLLALLALTYLLRRKLGRLWMTLHRVLTILLITFLILHLVDMGIQLPGRLLGGGTAATASSAAVSESAAGESDAAASNNAVFGSGTAGSSAASSEAVSSESSAAASSETTSSETTSSESTAASDSMVQFSGATLADGTYQGSAQGYSGTTTVEVTVAGGQVTDITVVSENDSPQFFARAQALLDTIIGQQSLEVDAVSGATFSSAGLINAVYDALGSAVTSGTLQVNSIDLSNVQRGH